MGDVEVKDVEVVEDPSTSTEGAPKATQDDAASVDVPWNKDKRFQEFLKEKKSLEKYKELGDPQSLADALSKARMLDDLMKQAEGSPEEGKSKDPAKEEREAARAALLQLLPELGHLAGAAQKMDILVTSIEKAARSETKSLMAEYGLATDKADVAEMEDFLANVIKADEDLAEDFYTKPRETVKKAYQKAMKKWEDAAAMKAAAGKQKDKEKLSTLPKTHPAGGGTGSVAAPNGPPKSMKDLEKAFRAGLGD